MVGGERPSDQICRKILILSFSSLSERGPEAERGLLKKEVSLRSLFFQLKGEGEGGSERGRETPAGPSLY